VMTQQPSHVWYAGMHMQTTLFHKLCHVMIRTALNVCRNANLLSQLSIDASVHKQARSGTLHHEQATVADSQTKTRCMNMCPSTGNELSFAVEPEYAHHGFCSDIHSSFSVLQQALL